MSCSKGFNGQGVAEGDRRPRRRLFWPADLAMAAGIRGMDALVAQTAKENNTALVSLDFELLKLIKNKATVKSVEQLV